MEIFLAASKNCVINIKDYHHIKVVLGNPTCDLDSAVCALAYGFLKYKETEKKDTKIGVIPMLNITKDEFYLRNEVVYYLRYCNVSKDLLTFRNDINLQNLHDSGKLELILVDHHILRTEDIGFANSVSEIIDHRPQDNTWSWTGCALTLTGAGSCATLVARNILERRPDTIKAVCKLLKGPILIDTVNFSKEANRATLLDYEIMAQLDKICGTNITDRIKLYKEILNVKSDISELSPYDLLIKDLKITNEVLISGFPILVKEFLELEDAMEALKVFCLKQGYQLAILMGIDLKNDNMIRDIAIYSSKINQTATTLIEALTTSVNPNLQLTEVKREDSATKLLVLYKQDNMQVSRKQIFPIIQNALFG
ncbi:PREDICTED: protein prune homolog [Ceratosolen solmsi marchali]|uniref:Protein prune homolog n=1 Tax=Ceratosolen solmsi marchali TaxID=326594 RepID=A0AAJ6YCE4_9HYME|nr:PREDICTED: protein prune homolog [Ceratosolen solmsi marchali]